MMAFKLLKQIGMLTAFVVLGLLLQRFVFVGSYGLSIQPQAIYARILSLRIVNPESFLFFMLSLFLTTLRAAWLYIWKKKNFIQQFYLSLTLIFLELFSIFFSILVWQVAFPRGWYVTNLLIIASFVTEFYGWQKLQGILKKKFQTTFLISISSALVLALFLVLIVFEVKGLRLQTYVPEPI